MLGRPVDDHEFGLLMGHDISDCWITFHIFESRMSLFVVSLTMMGCSGTHQRLVRGQGYPVRTAASVMLIVLGL